MIVAAATFLFSEDIMIETKIIADSVSESGKRITTLQIKFHRFILPEFNTHRVFSRNFSSSRAIPTSKLIEQVQNDPAMPVHWGRNQPGMQAETELEGDVLNNAKFAWKRAAETAADMAQTMTSLGAHKQIVNRIIEPYLWANGIVTSTEWDNWFELRAHPDAQPEIHELALRMQEAMAESTPQLLKIDEWHLPYISKEERETIELSLLQKISAARCCRVSYLKHDGTSPNAEEDLKLFDRLAGAVPLHASPLEHQATPMYNQQQHLQGNFKDWIQYRKTWEQTFYNR